MPVTPATTTPPPSASAPQIIASQPIPIDITATKALAVEIAKVPDGKTLDPHWTTYVQAIGTPVVAVIAAVIAARIQWRQAQIAKAAAQTAKNKLKLDLFDKRFKQYDAANQLMLHGQQDEPKRDAFMAEKLIDLIGAEFLFSEEINHFVQKEAFVRLARILEAERKLADPTIAPADVETLTLKRKELKQWFETNYPKLKELMRPYLQLTHEHD